MSWNPGDRARINPEESRWYYNASRERINVKFVVGDVDDDGYRIMINVENALQCICPIDMLMSQGCRCGGR